MKLQVAFLISILGTARILATGFGGAIDNSLELTVSSGGAVKITLMDKSNKEIASSMCKEGATCTFDRYCGSNDPFTNCPIGSYVQLIAIPNAGGWSPIATWDIDYEQMQNASPTTDKLNLSTAGNDTIDKISAKFQNPLCQAFEINESEPGLNFQASPVFAVTGASCIVRQVTARGPMPIGIACNGEQSAGSCTSDFHGLFGNFENFQALHGTTYRMDCNNGKVSCYLFATTSSRTGLLK